MPAKGYVAGQRHATCRNCGVDFIRRTCDKSCPDCRREIYRKKTPEEKSQKLRESYRRKMRALLGDRFVDPDIAERRRDEIKIMLMEQRHPGFRESIQSIRQMFRKL